MNSKSHQSVLAYHIQGAQQGEQTSFNYLLDTFWNDVYGFQLKRTHNEYEAEDITIRTFSKAFDKIEMYNSDYVFKTWLISISKNIHIDQIRKQKNKPYAQSIDDEKQTVYTLADSAPTPEDRLITEQNLAELLRFIKLLKPAYKEVIMLRYFQEMTYKEIAEELQEPINNIKVKLLRAKKLLANIIQEKSL